MRDMVEQTEETIEETEEQTSDTPSIESKYRRIILAAQRSKQLQRGATPRVDMDIRKSKPTRIAMRELEEGKISFEETPVPGIKSAA